MTTWLLLRVSTQYKTVSFDHIVRTRCTNPGFPDPALGESNKLNWKEAEHRRDNTNFVHIGVVPTEHILKVGKLSWDKLSVLRFAEDHTDGDYRWLLSEDLSIMPRDEEAVRLIGNRFVHE